MKRKLLILTILTFIYRQTFSQTYPTFGPETLVTISGLTFDAMEPFISPDGNTLFFNSLNSGGNTNLYYATRINDSTFTYVGMVEGTYDPTPDHLDAVASLDSLNNFFWVSLRNIPNLHRGNYLDGNVDDISQVYGTCNIFSPSGWLIMDAAIHHSGNLLYYSNGYFGPTYTECVGVPCEAKLGVAQIVNDSTFNKTIDSDAIFSNVNDSNYLVYAPQVTNDGLELYYTRLFIGGFNTEICVSVRNNVNDTFSLPSVIYSNFGYFPEAATPTTDKQKIYYHQKDNDLQYKIYLRYRDSLTGVNDQMPNETFTVYPNPTTGQVHVQLPMMNEHFEIDISSMMGEKLLSMKTIQSIDIANFPSGIYFLTVKQNNITRTTKIIKN